MHVHLLFGLVVAHLQGGVVVNKRGFQFIDSDPVDAALFTVQFDPVQVDYCGENGQLNIALKKTTKQRCRNVALKSKIITFIVTNITKSRFEHSN